MGLCIFCLWKIIWRQQMSRRPRSAQASVANSFSLGGIQFSGPVSDVGQEKHRQLWKQKATREVIVMPTQNMRISPCQTVLQMLLVSCTKNIAYAYSKLALQKNQSWATTYGIPQQTQLVILWGNRTWCGCIAWGGAFWTAQRWWCHFRNLPFSLCFTRLFSAEERKQVMKWETSLLQTNLFICFLMYLDAEKAQETHLQQWNKLAAEDTSKSHLLTLTELPAPSDMLHQGSHSTDSLTRTSVCYCLFVRKSHFSGWLLSSGAIVTWDWWSQGLVPLLAAQITSFNSSSRGLSICT